MNNSYTPNAHRTTTARENTGLSDKMIGAVQQLLDSSRQLRDALVHRRITAIWEILSMQEQQAMLLEQYGRLWRELSDRPHTDDPEWTSTRNHIVKLLNEAKSLQRGNFSLAQCFLAVVRRTLHECGGEEYNSRPGYNRRGRPGMNSASRFIYKLG